MQNYNIVHKSNTLRENILWVVSCNITRWRVRSIASQTIRIL